MLFEPAHVRLAGAWDIDKAQNWLLAALASGRLDLDGLVTHRINAAELGGAYDGLLKKKRRVPRRGVALDGKLISRRQDLRVPPPFHFHNG
jgi:hypothetical protein